MAARTTHGKIEVWSVQAGGYLFLQEGENSIRVSADELLNMLIAHAPQLFDPSWDMESHRANILPGREEA